jgi:hypothetical protein
VPIAESINLNRRCGACNEGMLLERTAAYEKHKLRPSRLVGNRDDVSTAQQDVGTR